MRTFTYPIKETIEESWERLLKIYDLTDKLVGNDYVVPVSTYDIMKAWRDMVIFLTNTVELLNGVDYIYEAIYHIRYRVFSEKVSEQNELKLVLLVEDELCRCGYAFHVWSNMREFQSVYEELLFPHKKGPGWRSFCPRYVEMYLAGNMANRIMLKDKSPIDWGDELDCNRATYPYGPDYMRYRVTVFEQAIEILLPESSEWYEEWMDGKYIAERIKARYNMDFTNDSEGFDNLIRLITERKFPKVCAYYLYRLNNITPELLDVLWGDNIQHMMQKCFLNIFQRYKAAKKAGTKRSCYSQQAVQKSWLYCWNAQRRNIEETELSQTVKKAMFRIELNI